MWFLAVLAVLVILGVLVYASASLRWVPQRLLSRRPLPNAFSAAGEQSRALLVTAHPDDECMFFTPTIINLLSEGRRVFLLCLSTGNRYGIGKQRKQELYASCQVLGLPSANITVVSHTNLPDDSSAAWNEELVAHLILKSVESLDIDTIISFDENGVSGHNNHRAIHKAIKYLLHRRKLPLACRPYAVKDVGLLRKYLGVFDVPFTNYMSTYVYVSTHAGIDRGKRAMAAHQSQNVWFRKLYVRFSRYMIVNDLRQLD